MGSAAQGKWDRASVSFDLFSRGAERRWEPVKRATWAKLHGRVLFLAIGTGLEIPFLPPGLDLTGLDISWGMLRQAKPRVAGYDGGLSLVQSDAESLALRDDSFDCIATSCTFCSVPEPVAGLRELRRVLKPGGELRMFEHTGSRWFPFNLMLNLMTPLSRKFGPELNRNTVANVEKAGLRLRSVENVYLDVVKIIVAAK